MANKKQDTDTANCATGTMMFDDEKKKQVLMRLKRLNGQIAGIIKMIENDEKGCREVIQQIKAGRSAIDTVGKMVIACYLESCMANNDSTDDAMELLMNF